MKYLKSFHLKEKYTKYIRLEIMTSIYASLYAPLLNFLADCQNPNMLNDNNLLASAIRKGDIQYIDGKFYGNWNAQLSKAMRNLGATFNHKDYTWEIDHLPADLELAVGDASIMYQNIMGGIGGIDFEFKPIPKTAYDFTAKEMKQDFNATLLGLILLLPKDIKTKKYIDELNEAVFKFARKEKERILSYINNNSSQIINLTNLYKYLDTRMDIANRKSKFLADCETNLLLNDYKKEQYKTFGITQYKWQTMEDSKVRPRHKELNGQIIDYDFPPIVDLNTGRTAHAGEDYNCRCRQIPIVFNKK